MNRVTICTIYFSSHIFSHSLANILVQVAIFLISKKEKSEYFSHGDKQSLVRFLKMGENNEFK